MTDFRDYDILTLPGWKGSDEDHWQTVWERALPNVRRVEQENWDAPDYGAWASRLGAAVAASERPILLVGHSLGSVLASRWLVETGGAGVAGAFLVAVSDRDRWEADPAEPQGFAPITRRRLPVPTFVLASQDDPRVDFGRAKTFADDWRARLIDVGALGHIGSAANLGVWPQGLVWLGQLTEVAAGGRIG